MWRIAAILSLMTSFTALSSPFKRVSWINEVHNLSTNQEIVEFRDRARAIISEVNEVSDDQMTDIYHQKINAFLESRLSPYYIFLNSSEFSRENKERFRVHQDQYKVQMLNTLNSQTRSFKDIEKTVLRDAIRQIEAFISQDSDVQDLDPKANIRSNRTSDNITLDRLKSQLRETLGAETWSTNRIGMRYKMILSNTAPAPSSLYLEGTDGSLAYNDIQESVAYVQTMLPMVNQRRRIMHYSFYRGNVYELPGNISYILSSQSLIKEQIFTDIYLEYLDHHN